MPCTRLWYKYNDIFFFSIRLQDGLKQILSPSQMSGNSGVQGILDF